MAFRVGQHVGAYRVVRPLGHGGMGAVYEVEHRELGVRYALKAFTLDHGDADLLRRKFLVEGRILARLHHPCLVRVYDLGCDETTGCPYFTMDLVVGPAGEPCTLEDLRRAGGVTESDIARWYADLSGGLEAMHAAGVVHRDVKLENVLVNAEGRAVLADLGISRILDDAALAVTAIPTRFSDAGHADALLMGTAEYVAPEIRSGGAVTPAADYYSLGVLLFRLLTDVWFEPGTAVLDLLAPFDPVWADAISALTSPDPACRRLPRVDLDASAKNRPSGLRRVTRRDWLIAAGLAGVLGIGTILALQYRKMQEFVVPPESCFAIPDFIR